MYKLFLAAVISLAVSLPTLTQAATYGGGSGTPSDPYKIWTHEQMNTIGDNPGDWDKHFRLMADIDMSDYTGTQYNIIGNFTIEFTGSFDGQGHKINNLTYTTTAAISYVALFGYIRDATIQNLELENVSFILSEGEYIGALAGYNGGAITNCDVREGSVSGEDFVGGLVGINSYSGTLSLHDG